MNVVQRLIELERQGHRFSLQDGQIKVASPNPGHSFIADASGLRAVANPQGLAAADVAWIRANRGAVISVLESRLIGSAIERIAQSFDRFAQYPNEETTHLAAMPLDTLTSVDQWERGWLDLITKTKRGVA